MMDRRRFSYGCDWDFYKKATRQGPHRSDRRRLSTNGSFVNGTIEKHCINNSSSGYTDDSSDGDQATRKRCRNPLSLSDAAKFNKMSSSKCSDGAGSKDIDVHRFTNALERRDLGSAGSRTSVSSRDSNGSVTKKERRNALKARVEALRERYCNSSSEEDEPNCFRSNTNLTSMRYNSDETLNRKARCRKRPVRRDDDDFRCYNSRNSSNFELQRKSVCDDGRVSGISTNDPPFWNATVVYQRSRIYDDPATTVISTARRSGCSNDGKQEDSSHSSYHSAFENSKENYNLSRHTKKDCGPNSFFGSEKDGQRTNWKFLAPPTSHSQFRNHSNKQQNMQGKTMKGESRAPAPPPRVVTANYTIHQAPIVVAEARQTVIAYPPPHAQVKERSVLQSKMSSPTGSSAEHFRQDCERQEPIPPVTPGKKVDGIRGIKKFIQSYEASPTNINQDHKSCISENVKTREDHKSPEKFRLASKMYSKDGGRLINRRASDISVRSVADFWRQKEVDANKVSKNIPNAPNVHSKAEQQSSWCYNSVYDSLDTPIENGNHKIRRSNSETLVDYHPLRSRPANIDKNLKFNKNISNKIFETDKISVLKNNCSNESKSAIPCLENAENLFEELVKRNKEKRKSKMGDAITELENMYEKLNLGDEELLDRADRRDLPVRIQLLAQKPLPADDSIDKLDSMAVPTPDSDTFSTQLDPTDCLIKGRTPKVRRSFVPDKINDDLAFRRNKSSPKQSVDSNSNISYLLCSPAFADPDETSPTLFNYCEPDIITDDVSYRNYQRANMECPRILNQKPFGIPIGPLPVTSTSNYAVVNPKKDETRPTFHPKGNPDVIRDDMAFRNLRKGAKNCTKVDFEELDRIISGETLSKKQGRALKVMSVYLEPQNISHRRKFDRAQSLTDLNPEIKENESKKSINSGDVFRKGIQEEGNGSHSQIDDNNNTNISLINVSGRNSDGCDSLTRDSKKMNCEQSAGNKVPIPPRRSIKTHYRPKSDNIIEDEAIPSNKIQSWNDNQLYNRGSDRSRSFSLSNESSACFLRKYNDDSIKVSDIKQLERHQSDSWTSKKPMEEQVENVSKSKVYRQPIFKSISMDLLAFICFSTFRISGTKEMEVKNVDEEEEDLLSRMSLSDKIKLFKKKSEDSGSSLVNVRKQRRQNDSWRFKTQPVTNEEVESATNSSSSGKLEPDMKVMKSMSMMVAKELQNNMQKSVSSLTSKFKSDGIPMPSSIAEHKRPSTNTVSKPNLSSDDKSDSSKVKHSDVETGKKNDIKVKSNRPLKSILKTEIKVNVCSSSGSSDDEMECSGRLNTVHENNTLVKKEKPREAERKEKKINPAVARRLQANQRKSDGRLASLQDSQQNGWKERLQSIKSDDPEKEIGVKDSNKVETPDIKTRPKVSGGRSARPVSIADRLNLLEGSKKDWKKRVEKSDAEQFTVAGKMGQETTGNVTPSSQRKKLQVPQLQIFKSKTDDINRLKSMGAVSLFPVTPMKPKMADIAKSKSTLDNFESNRDSSDSEEEPGDIFSTPASFNLLSVDAAKENATIDEDSFSSFLLQTAKSSDKLHVEHRTVKVQRRQTTSGNPIRKLASRSDLSYSYKEESKENRECDEKTKSQKDPNDKCSTPVLAKSALAGLASTEDFAAISLRKADSSDAINANALLPYNDLMLLKVKGRRQVQTRLVEPKWTSINEGDCFVLVTPNILYQYVGRLCNVIEKSKSSDVASVIKSKKDLGHKIGCGEVIVIDDECNSGSKDDRCAFWKLLESPDDDFKPKEAGPPEEDEDFECSVVSTNKVYKVEKTSLIPCKDFWGGTLNFNMLSPNQAYVFDFGSEMYVWHGKQASLDERKVSVQLAKELWSQSYDYVHCNVNPVVEGASGKGDRRPEWAVLGRVTQHVESILFKEKFVDWPNEDRTIPATKNVRASSSESDASDISSGKNSDLSACDADEMLNAPTPDVDLVLEMSHLGRGVEYHDEKERRHFEVETRNVQVWHVQDNAVVKLDRESWGQFHSCDTYVVRWLYTVVQTGRSLTGGASKHNKVGRDRCAYFFWQGRDSSVNEKGAGALMTVELDEERGPHVRVIQGKEMPCFLNIFTGGMVVHTGKRSNSLNKSDCGDWRLYVLLGEAPSEAMLVEVRCDISSLRSRAIFMLVNVASCHVYIWYGSRISTHRRTVSRAALEHLKSKKDEFGFCNKGSVVVSREHEGNESEEFFEGLSSNNVQLYSSLRLDEKTFDYTMRVYRLTSVLGTFSSIELLCPHRKNDLPCAFPVLQADLYKIAQPALLLLDNETEIFLWQGWFPKGNSCPRNRWRKERMCAMQTAIDYCNLKKLDERKVLLVSAGFEPLHFKNLFAEWCDGWKDEIDDFDDTDCSKPQVVIDILNKLKKTSYTLEELKEQPEGVDPNKPESYLADHEFQKTFEMSKTEFYEMPSWKQLELRKSAGLF